MGTELCQEDWTVYWKGLWHGMLVLLPALAYLFRKWKVAVKRMSVEQPVPGSFMNELFAFEVVLVAGAELKAVRDQLGSVEKATPADDEKVKALKERAVDVATVLQRKLETITPIVSFLLEETVVVIKSYRTDLDFDVKKKN